MSGAKTHTAVAEPASQLDSEAALAIADEFLIMQVGDLLAAETPLLSDDGRWVMSITLGNVVQGMLGEVGTIAVDSRTGEVFFSDQDRARVAARAEELSRAAAH